MVVQREIYPYFQWLLTGGGAENWGALPRFLLIGVAFALLALAIGFLLSLVRGSGRGGFFRSMLQAGDQVYHTSVDGVRDLLATSPRRILALAQLAVKEAWRRRVLIALAVFFLILLFANWFLSTDHQRPARLYLSFVLTATTYLILLIALLLSAFSLPGDFKSKTIYTVVTKPVRAGEIILGRILGFSFVGTVLLVIMAICSYIFVARSLGHTHEAELDSVKRIESRTGDYEGLSGRTTLNANHRHDIVIDENGNGRATLQNGHYHDATAGDGSQVTIGPAEGFLRARIPQYGELHFIDRTGAKQEHGISVGSEWTYRSFIDGFTLATAIWKFNDINESSLIRVTEGDATVEALPIALTVRVFKTHKGVIGRPISGTLQFRNPQTGEMSDKRPFLADDAQVQEMDLSRQQLDEDGEPIDLLKDLVSKDGELEILVQCAESGQYFGFAQADMYIRHPDASPIVNFAKVYAGIWVQMVIVIAVGVAISTLVSGPVAMLFTAAFVLLGFWRSDFLDIANGASYGGGPGESIVRMVKQANQISNLEQTWGVILLQSIDSYIARPLMWCVGQVLPDFSSLNSVLYAADGYNVPWNRVFQDLTLCGGYVLGLTVLGYFLLRTREVAR